MGIEWRSGSLDGIKRNRWDGMGEVGDLIGYIYGISCSLLALDKTRWSSFSLGVTRIICQLSQRHRYRLRSSTPNIIETDDKPCIVLIITAQLICFLYIIVLRSIPTTFEVSTQTPFMLLPPPFRWVLCAATNLSNILGC